MLRALLWSLILLTLSGAASAEPMAVPFGLEVASAGQGADASTDPEPVLDLDFEPPAPALLQRPASSSLVLPAARARTAKAPFSVGLDIRTRHEIGDEGRQETADEASLTDEVAGVMRRSTFGLKGRYRF